MGIIYLITNTTSGKRYVGQTKGSLRGVTGRHLSLARGKQKLAVSWAIAKYGAHAFRFETLAQVTQLGLNPAERWFIRQLETLAPRGYNLTSGGDSSCVVSEQTREKLRAPRPGRRGFSHSAETRLKIRDSCLGKNTGPRNAEICGKISRSMRAKSKSEVHKANIRAGVRRYLESKV